MFCVSVYALAQLTKCLNNVQRCTIRRCFKESKLWNATNERKHTEIFNSNSKCCLHTSSTKHLFWEPDPKGGYSSNDVKKYSQLELIRMGLKDLRKEIMLWKDEVKEHLECDPVLLYRPGEVDIMWNFEDHNTLSNWLTTSDSDHKQGFSTCKLEPSPGGKALFSGELSTRVPKDGRVKKAGYCSVRSPRARKSFKRDSYYNWQHYTHLVMRVRGDGRSYLINIGIPGFYDLTWNDIYHYVLFTRGGPYWQVAKIPFSKFFLGSKGRVQDKQTAVPLNRVATLGISVGDKINGPFNLEIDYIGLENDPSHKEEFAYEMYKAPRFLLGH